MCERTVLVSDLPKDVKEDDLHIYFQSRKKSDGGDIESIVYYPVTRSAKITFTDEQVVKRVVRKHHHIKDSRFAVQMASDLSGDTGSTSILVSGLSSRTTEDALQNYFENSRRSSGGDVKEVQVNGDKAIVTFELPEIAKRVLEWGKHTLDDHPLTVSRMQQDQPKKPTPTSEHDSATNEERSRVVRITGISHNTTKDALLNFFENKRRSGGGEIEDIQYIQDESLADITFCSAEDAERVSQKESLKLDDAKIGLTLKEIPKVLPKDPYKLHVMDISNTTTKDGLSSFIEVASGKEILSMIFGSNSNVMVMFKEPPDIEKVQRKCITRALDGSHVKIETVSICDCVEVCGLGPSTTRDTILYYFENARKSGGGDVKKVEYVDEETRALVFFEDFSVVDSVVAREHVINDATLKVVPHYSFLGEISANPRGRKKEKQLKQGSGDVELCSIDNKIEKTKWKDYCIAIETYINLIVTHEVVVSQAAWNEMIEQAKQKCSSVKDRLHVVCKEKERLFLLRGKKQDVDPLAEQLDDLSKEIDKKIEYDKAKITKAISLTKPQLNLLNSMGFVKKIQAQFKDLEAKMLKEDEELSIHFRGPDQVVREGNIAVWETLSKMKDQEMELPKSIVSIVASIPGNVFLSKELKNNQIDAVISSDANDDTKLIVTAVDRRDVNKAMDLIKKVTAEDSVSLDPDQKRLIMSERWMQLIDNFKKSMLLKVTTELVSSTVWIAGVKEEVVKAKSQIDAFFEENTIISKMVEADAGCIKFLFRFEKDEIKRVEETLKHHSVKICCDENDEDISIRGTKEGTEQACKNVQKLIDQIKHRTIDLDKPGIKRLFNESQGKKLLSNVENDHTCIIERCTLTDDNKRRSAVGLKLNESLSKRICSCVTPEGKNIILFKGDLTEHKVDVMVNAANQRLQHIGGVAKAISQKGGSEIQAECDELVLRHGDVLDGEVVVTSPGKLPCKRLVHAVGPTWRRSPWSTYKDEETKEELILGQTVFNALDEAKDFTSIALPAISAGVFGFPADVCAKTILESVLAYSEENARSNLSEIHIVDMNDDVIKAFTREMRSRFSKDKSFSDSAAPVAKVVESGKGRKFRGRRKSVPKDEPISPEASSTSIDDSFTTTQGMKIDIIIGDLAKEEAHAIVNTVSHDLDLSKNLCAKALSHAAGPGLQQECKGKGNMKAGGMVVTEGYSLGCKNVFHVAAGGWQNGEGEQVLRSLINSCLKEADKRGFLSIAFPAIGTGNLGFPRDIVAKVFFDEVDQFKKNHPQTSLMEVHFVLFHKDKPTIQAFEDEQRNRKETAQGTSTKPMKGKRRSYPLKSEGRFDEDDLTNTLIGSVRVELVPGDITKEATDAIVTVSNTYLDVSLGGGVGAAIARKGGRSIQMECNKLGKQEPGSIAVPAVGTGNASIAPKEAAKALLNAVGKFCKTTPSSVKLIRIVVFQEHMLKYFYDAIEDLAKAESTSGASGGIWSWLKGLIFGTGGANNKGHGPSTTDRGYIEMAGNSGTTFKPDTRMWLKVFASSDKQLSKADTAIKELIREQSKKKTIDNTDIEGLSPTQEERILRLQEKYFTEIEVQKRFSRIIISGVINDVSETAFAIFEILNEKAEEEHKRKYAELVSKNVHWFYIDGDEEVQYDDETNAKIEQAYMDKQTSINITLIEDHKEQRYKIDFASMTETNVDAHKTTRVVRKEHGKGTYILLMLKMSR
ncbi:hypothetical protein QZH41_017197 [Actinostola sp. cb2023]|nr:hypothetical protein QZH41_017197 [Actinostola sp. cb2023]